MINKSIVFLLLVSSILSACSDKLELSRLKGSYKGIFTYHDQASSIAPPPSGEIVLTFTENAYLSTGNTNRTPAGGSGVFELTEEGQIKFEDQNIWTADFDWNLILNGYYKYKTKGDSLILKKELQAGLKTYEYRLKRTE
jgi:hypothetical protein